VTTGGSAAGGAGAIVSGLLGGACVCGEVLGPGLLEGLGLLVGLGLLLGFVLADAVGGGVGVGWLFCVRAGVATRVVAVTGGGGTGSTGSGSCTGAVTIGDAAMEVGA
jgi:hypothetical protein